MSRLRYWTVLALSFFIGFELWFGLYMTYRTIRRSLYAADAEIAHPALFLDSATAFVIFVVAITGTVIARGLVEGTLAAPRWLRREPLTPTAMRRRAKLFNERVKLAANGLNAIGASSFLALFLTPILTRSPNGAALWLSGLSIAAICHGFAQLIMGLWKAED